MIKIHDTNVNDEIFISKEEYKKIKILWNAMHERVKNPYDNIASLTYDNVIICDEWYKLSNFAKDIKQIHGFNFPKWQLDKDLLSNGIKLYSKDTCCFLPSIINMNLSLQYKKDSSLPYGVSYNTRDSNYRAQISYKGRTKPLGQFKNIDDALITYKRAKESYIKELTNEYKNMLDCKVYDKLMNWTIT